MRIYEQKLKEMANAYVKNGVLTKWRYDSRDDTHINHRLNLKGNDPLTEEELSHVKTFNNVIIEDEQNVQFLNFSGDIPKY